MARDAAEEHAGDAGPNGTRTRSPTGRGAQGEARGVVGRIRPEPEPEREQPEDPAEDVSNPLLEDLTEPQRRAVTTTEGPLLILAAAGSGKTRVITRRIAYLLELGIPPWQVLAVTFTNKAAGEMRERVASLVADHPRGERVLRGLTISTFHSLCARLLRRYAPMAEGLAGFGVGPDYTIYDSSDQLALVKQVIKSMGLESSQWPPRQVLGVISNAKNQMLDAAAFGQTAGDFYERSVAKIYEKYQSGLRSANAVDFDDLLLLTVRLLREVEPARREVQERWRYLMIDEYQDTNTVQFVLSTLVCGSEEGRAPNVCVVGDPDQSIYGWRGADISNILDFEKRYPGAALIALGRNFRSTAPILAAADHLIRHNKQRKHKDLYTRLEGGEPPAVVLCQDEHHEARLVVDWFRALASGDESLGGDGAGDVAWKDMAVFYRNNALSRVMEDALRGSGVPYVIARGTAFYERAEVKDALAYLRVVANRADDVSLRRILNKPARKIGKTTQDALEAWAQSRGVPLFEACARAEEAPDVSPAAAKAVGAFVRMVDEWTGSGSFMGADVPSSLSGLVSRVVSESGLEKHYKKVDEKAGEGSDEDRVANLQELVSSASEFELEYDVDSDVGLGPGASELAERAEREETMEEMLAAAEAEASGEGPSVPDAAASDDRPAPPLLAMVRAYLESVALVADADKVDPARGAVTLMTLHAAKGLEFPAVAMIGLEEGLLPAMRSMDSEESLEEERRLAFVGITRAMRRLMITSARVRTHRGMRDRTIPSRFLSELPADGVTVSDQSDPGGCGDDGGGGSWGGRGAGPAAAGAAGSGWEDYEFDQRDPSEKMAAARARGGSGRSGGGGLAEGASVRHPQFGPGVILEVNGLGRNRRAKVRFRDAGTKTLVLEHARLTVV